MAIDGKDSGRPLTSGPGGYNEGTSASEPMLRSRVRGDAFDRFQLTVDGTQYVGDGTTRPSQSGTTVPGERTVYVSTGSLASDSNSGLSARDAVSTISKAKELLGTTAGRILLGYGSWSITTADGYDNGVTLDSTGTVLEGSGHLLSTISLNGTFLHGVGITAGGCQVRNLHVIVAGGTTAYGVGVYVGASGSAQSCRFENVYVERSAGTLYNGFSVGGTNDGATTTNTSTTVLDGNVKSYDVGATVTGTGIPGSTTISSVVPGVSFVMSQAATGSATVTATIARSVTATTTNGSTTVLAATAKSGDKNSSISGTGIPGGATISSVVDGVSYTISAAASATGSITATVSRADSLNGPDIAETNFIGCQSRGTVANAGFLIGSGSPANILNTYLWGCTAANGVYGVRGRASGFTWHAGGFGTNTTADIFISGSSSHPYVIDGVRSELSAKFLLGPGANFNNTVEVRNVKWGAANLVSTGLWIDWTGNGRLTLSNVEAYGTSTATPAIALNAFSTSILSVIADGVAQPTAPFATAFANATGTASTTTFLIVRNYQQMATDSTVSVTTTGPFVLLPTSTSNSFNGTSRKTFAPTGLAVGNAAAASGPVGTVVKKIQVFDAAGTSLGYVPVYDAIT